MSKYTQANRPFRVYTTLGDDVLLLENLEGEEAISRPFEFRLDMVSENPAIAAASLINQPVHVEIDLAGGKKRYIHGLVSSFTSRAKPCSRAVLLAGLVSPGSSPARMKPCPAPS